MKLVDLTPVNKIQESSDIMRINDPLMMILNKKLKEMGIKKQISKAESAMKTVDKGKIDPKYLGIFGNAFETIDYELKVGASVKRRVVTFELSFQYQHPSGSNGYTHRMSYWEEDGKWSR